MKPRRPKLRPYPERLDRSQRYYSRTVDVRAFLFRPLVRLLDWLHVTPNMVSYSGVLFMGVFAGLAGGFPGVGMALVLGSVFADLTDGVLAHYQGTASDRGKLVDMVCDSAAFTLFIGGCVHAGLLDGLPGVLLAYTMVLSKLFRSIINSFYLQTDWHFKAVAGFLPNLSVGIVYVAFGIWAIWDFNAFPWIGYPLAGVLGFDSVVFYVRVMRVSAEEEESG